MSRITRDEVVALSDLGGIVSKTWDTYVRKPWKSSLATYLKADAIASVVGLAGAEAATVALHHADVSDLTNVIGTLAFKSACFYGANIAAYTLLHRESHKTGERCASEDAANLSRANIYGAVVAGVLKFGGHYAALQYAKGAMPYWVWPLVVYPAAGLIGGAVRHVMNYHNGLIMPREKDTTAAIEKYKNATLEKDKAAALETASTSVDGAKEDVAIS